MVIPVTQTDGLALALDREEAQQVFDSQTREYLGITAEEFVRRYEAGELSEASPDVLYLLMVRDYAA